MPRKKLVNTLGLDMDGVLADFISPTIAHFGLEPVGDNDPVSYDFLHSTISPARRGCKTITKSQLQSDPHLNSEAFWENLPILTWAHELVEEGRRRGPISFITSPGGFKGAQEGKRKWLVRHGFLRDEDTLIFSSDKGKHSRPGLLLVEDNPRMAYDWVKAGGESVLVRRPWTINYLSYCERELLTMLRTGVL